METTSNENNNTNSVSNNNNNNNITNNSLPELRLDILHGFGADFDLPIRENLVFVNRAICYPIGRHIILRDILSPKNESRQNEEIFIYLDDETINVTCLNVSRDNYLLLIAGQTEKTCDVSVYNLNHLNFTNFTIYKPRRKLITSLYKRFIYSSFSEDGNLICCIGEENNGNLKGLIYDIQTFKYYKNENYSPKYIFDLPHEVNKITFLNNRVLCTSGKNHLSFWVEFESTCKEYKSTVNLQKNYVDHCWVYDNKIPTVIAVTEDNELYVFNAVYDKSKSFNSLDNQAIVISKFTIKQTLNNLFQNDVDKDGKQIFNKFSALTTRVGSFHFGLVIGSNKGNILFLEKNQKDEYIPIRFTMREKEGSVTGFSFSSFNEDHIAVSFNTNEIAYVNLTNIFQNLRNEKFELEFNIICDGFHNGPITSMDVSLQRPIIVTTSKFDRTVRVWNYLTGHCEYCKIILEEKDNNEEKELNILSCAIHPNGYYIAISDNEMIRFFHLCYKELRFYNNDQIGNEANKANCTLLKFSNGGHLLSAISEKKMYLIRSYTRETVKIVNTPHSGNIITVYFHPGDNFIYTCGSEGFIIQYNLFDFNWVKITNKFALYSDSIIYPLYSGEDKVELKDNIISCGFMEKNFVITNVNFQSNKTEEISQCHLTKGVIDEKCNAICNINTKRYDINSIAIGTEDGKICLYSHDITNSLNPARKNNKHVKKFDKVFAHKKKVNFLYYSRDTNLLFSAGDDGNLFIYAIYEYPDGETVAFDDNRAIAINQINSILDEGLGDNVLLNLNEIFGLSDKMISKNELIYKLQRNIDESTKTFNINLKEKLGELNKKKEGEISELKNKIDQMIISNNSMIEDYEKRIEEINIEHRKKFNEREGVINEKIEDLNNEIINLKNLNNKIKNDFEKMLSDNNYDQLQKFRELEFELLKKFQILTKKNQELSDQLKHQNEYEKKKLQIVEIEHEYELNDRIEKYTKKLASSAKEIEDKNVDIQKLNDKLNKLEINLGQNENLLKNYKEENNRLLETINTLRKQLDAKELEKDALTKKLTETEINLQEKSKLENFSNQLKNELYKKNYEISSRFNNELNVKEELKDNKKNLEKQLDDTINLLINREKELSKHKILIEELKKKNEEQRHISMLKQKDLDNLLRKIYYTFQQNDKNAILRGIKEIYQIFLSDDAEKNFDSNKLNIDLKEELKKQIVFLQDELANVNAAKNQREKNQNSDYRKKMNENAMLIEEMSRLKRINNDHINTIKQLKFKNVSLQTNYNKIKNQMKNISSIPMNTNITLMNQSVVSDPNSMNRNTNQSNNAINTTSNMSIYYNTSMSTNQSDLLPMLNNALTPKQKLDMKNYKNRIFKPGKDNIYLPKEKLLKYNEMKKIIEGKNDIIQRLSAENDFLRQTCFSQMNMTQQNKTSKSREDSLEKNNTHYI